MLNKCECCMVRRMFVEICESHYETGMIIKQLAEEIASMKHTEDCLNE